MNLLILFFYIYPIIFIGLPLSTRILYALGGVFLFICQRFIDKRLFFCMVGIGACSTMFCRVGYFESDFLILLLCFMHFPRLLFFLQAMPWFTCLAEKRKTLIYPIFLKCFVYVVGIQSLLALLMFLFPALHDFMYSIIRLNELEDEMVDSTYGMRLQGWGSNFLEPELSMD